VTNILRGAKIADLPYEAATKFELSKQAAMTVRVTLGSSNVYSLRRLSSKAAIPAPSERRCKGCSFAITGEAMKIQRRTVVHWQRAGDAALLSQVALAGQGAWFKRKGQSKLSSFPPEAAANPAAVTCGEVGRAQGFDVLKVEKPTGEGSCNRDRGCFAR